jgi:hypothetical protein
MSGADKVKNKIEDLGGRTKEAIGKATGPVVSTPRTRSARTRRNPA